MQPATPSLMYSRRESLRLGAVTACLLASPRLVGAHLALDKGASPGHPAQCWEAFKRRFVALDGRVVDTGNGGVSHSEGQGWGLLFAVAFDDPVTFDGILGWTTNHLRRPHDRLHAWRYDPSAANPVPDLNNATDGDIFVASALWRAARAWGRPDLAAASSDLAHDVLRLLTRRVADRLVLLPGASGFESPDSIVLNPSYYAFPMIEDLAAAWPHAAWGNLRTDGLSLISDGRFGRWRLPPDWLAIRKVDGALQPAEGHPPRFSYDAIRVPLWLAWSQLAPLAVAAAFANYWASFPAGAPAWVDLTTNAVAPYPAPPGMTAVQRVASTAVSSPEPPEFSSVAAAPDYYSAALIGLSALAAASRTSHPAGQTP